MMMKDHGSITFFEPPKENFGIFGLVGLGNGKRPGQENVGFMDFLGFELASLSSQLGNPAGRMD